MDDATTAVGFLDMKFGFVTWGPPIPFVHGSHAPRDKFALSRRALFLLFAITLLPIW